MARPVFGIDLGTTNSAIAWVRDGTAEVIEFEGEAIMPSVVGLDDRGELMVGTPARNQLIAFPERTVASIKRKMGRDERIRIGDREHTPEEISAMILKELARRARAVTGERVEQVVITVPAFFHDAQRQATIAAGRIAGLDVLRVINEPTAAALAFDPADADGERCLLVYDLGGGTFDVSIVRAQEGLLEVLASHGDVHLGGDDFDRLIADDLARRMRETGCDDPRSDRVLDARLLRASEEAKIRLTEDAETNVREEFFGTRDGQPAHLDLLLERERFEELITSLLEKSLDSVHRTLSLADRALADIDDVLLVGGATRSPIVGRRLAEVLGRSPRRDVHPDLCVALGAAVQGARASGEDSARILVDVTPYSFGPSYLGELDGRLSPDCYHPVIERGTPLPVTRSDSYSTVVDGQKSCDIRIFQGESRNARENILVGRFTVTGLVDVPSGNEILCKMSLDLDGILHVEAVEKRTGLAKSVTIEGAAAAWTEERLAEARRRTAGLWREDAAGPPAERSVDGGEDEPVVVLPRADRAPWLDRARSVLERGRAVCDHMAAEDREEFDVLAGELEDALHRRDESGASSLLEELDELVHYVEEA